MRYLTRWFYSVVLFFTSSAVFADSSAPSITSAAVADHTDLSVNYLSQIFGTVGNVLSGTSGQMLGKLFYELNVGILIVAGMWLVYTIATMVLRSAMEGSFMSQKNNVALTFLKISIGMGALIPSPTTGYSAIQDIVMQVVVKGVSLADMTWSNGLEYIQEGGQVWHPPAGENKSSLTIDAAQMLYDYSVRAVFTDEVCMIRASATQAQKNMSNHNTGTPESNGAANYVDYQPNENDSKTQFEFPNSQTNATGCGAINWAEIARAHPSSDQLELAREAVYQAVYSIYPAAKQYACASDPSFAKTGECFGIQAAGMNDNISEIFFTNILAYANAISPIAQTATNRVSDNLKIFLQNAGTLGWMMAGRYIWDLSVLKDKYNNSFNYGDYLPSQKVIAPFSQDVSDYLGNRWAIDVVPKFNNYANGTTTGDGGSGAAKISNSKFIGNIIGSLAADVTNLLGVFKQDGQGSDPIYFLHKVGAYCLGIAGDIWINMAVLVATILLIGIVCQATVNVDEPIHAALDWIKPFIMGFAGVFLVVGAILTFYVPLYPFMLFTFGVVAWFIAVIEAMVAAPMIAFGLTHPDGHDFLGSAQQGLMLLLGVFLRPVLMVVGLIAALILSFVTFRLVNYSFAQFMGDLFAKQSSDYYFNPISVNAAAGNYASDVSHIATGVGSVISQIISVPLVLVMFCMIVYLVINQCYSLIYVLPDYVMRWIGGPTSQSSIQGMVSEARGVVSGVGSAVGKLGDNIESSMTRASKGISSKKDSGKIESKSGGGGASGAAGGSGSGAPM